MAAYVFDVNETLLDLSALDGPLFGGDRSAREAWFAQTLQSALVTTLHGRLTPFGELAIGALAMRRGGELGDGEAEALREAIATLPPHPDARPALEALRASGARLAALSQGAEATIERQLEGAGLRACFEAVVTAEDSGRLKPAPEPYRLTLQRLGLAPGDAVMVAAHPWDLAGAAQVGMGTVLVRRPGVVPDPSLPAPDRIVDDLRELAG